MMNNDGRNYLGMSGACVCGHYPAQDHMGHMFSGKRSFPVFGTPKVQDAWSKRFRKFIERDMKAKAI